MNWDIEYTDEFGSWWEVNVPLADQLYVEHLETLRKEGCNNG